MSLQILLMASQNQMTNVHELVVIIKNRAVTFIANYQKAFTLVCSKYYGILNMLESLRKYIMNGQTFATES